MKLLRTCFFLLTLGVAIPSFAGAPIYLSFSGTNANGNVNGTSFSNANWRVEYAINTNVADNQGSDQSVGMFANAILGGHLSINSAVYTLVGNSAKGNVYMLDDGTTNHISVNPISGGYLSWTTGPSTTFPALFSNVNSLNSAHLGTTISNNTADAYGNVSALDGRARQHESYDDATGQFTYTYVPVVMVDGASIVILAVAPTPSGLWTARVDTTSLLGPIASVPEPETYALLLAGLGLIGFLRRHRT